MYGTSGKHFDSAEADTCFHPQPFPSNTPLAIPEAIRPSHFNGAGWNKTAQLLSSVNASQQNSTDCCELSRLSPNIRSMSRFETNCPIVTSKNPSFHAPPSTPRAASSESMKNVQSSLSEITENESAVARRPRTAPQPEPPPRLKRGRTRSVRHACSTTFRPIRDYSPVSENRLSPVLSEETGGNNILHQRLDGTSNASTSSHGLASNGVVLHHDGCQSVNPFGSPVADSAVWHMNHSQFKPAGSTRASLESSFIERNSSASGLSDLTAQRHCCALCLQLLSNCAAEDPTITCSVDECNRCEAKFHWSCCRIWLEEAASDGDDPHCPMCLSRWDPLPLGLQGDSTCTTSEIQLVEHSLASTCCLFQERCNVDSDHAHLDPPTALTIPDRGPQAQTISTLASANIPGEAKSYQPVDASVSPALELNALPQVIDLPSAPSIPESSVCLRIPYPEYKNCAAAFSLEIADGIASRQSAARRQLALQQAAQLTVSRILLARQRYNQVESNGTLQSKENSRISNSVQQAAELDCLRVMFRLIQYLFDDPVDTVFIDALRAFREILGYLVCFNVETQTALQRAVGPILRRLLRFVGGASVLWTLRDFTSNDLVLPGAVHQRLSTSVDTSAGECAGATDTRCFPNVNPGDISNTVVDNKPSKANLRDRANLALATLVELAKGQSGALAIGRDVGCFERCLAVCGLQHMTRFVLSSAKFHATHLIGRLTLLDKLIRMDQAKSWQHESVIRRAENTFVQTNRPDRLAKRHLCSSLVFARRHLLPPAMNAEIAVCFPHHYQLQVSNRWSKHGKNAVGYTCDTMSNSTETQGSFSADSLYNTQLKASRVARRVFLTAARALLTYGNQFGPDANSVCNSNQTPAYSTHEFCPRAFVEIEIDRTEAPLAAWLRNKLAPVLYPNLCLSSERIPIPIRMAVSEASEATPDSSELISRSAQKLSNSHSVDNMPCSRLDNQIRTQSLSPILPEQADQSSIRQPPTPPPRRNLNVGTAVSTNDRKSDDSTVVTNHSQYVRVALEPAYDLVALSESGNYSSASECEEEETEIEQDNKMNTFDDTVPVNEPTYGGRSLGSEAELQTEQAAVLRSALRRCSRSFRPLLPVPALSIVMDAFRSTKSLPSSDEYYESIDWIKGPILGHGAFSQCYQARDTRTGLLMAVKRIRLGGGAVFALPTGKVSANEVHPADKVSKRKLHHNGSQPNYPGLLRRDDVIRSAECTTQLAEVQAEVDIMLRLNHPNVLRLFGAVYCAHRGVVDLFVEWMPGGSVTSLLQQYGAFNEAVTLAYGVQVVRGLAYLHKYGILHRDLKGANLLVDHTGSIVRISDFGASARLSGEISVAGQFQGQVIGTFSFMAPEVLRGETYGRACDIWSVGCCLIEMLTGKPPWHDARLTNRYALMFAIATSESPPTYPSDLHVDVRDVLDACFARHARDRPTASKLLNYRAFARLTESCSHSVSVASKSSSTLGDLLVIQRLPDSFKRTALLSK